jgi:hypothetical protein
MIEHSASVSGDEPGKVVINITPHDTDLKTL